MSMIRREVARTGHDNPAGILTLLEVCTQTIAIIGPSLGGLIGIGGWPGHFRCQRSTRAGVCDPRHPART
jgi:hypothetical protein